MNQNGFSIQLYNPDTDSILILKLTIVRNKKKENLNHFNPTLEESGYRLIFWLGIYSFKFLTLPFDALAEIIRNFQCLSFEEIRALLHICKFLSEHTGSQGRRNFDSVTFRANEIW